MSLQDNPASVEAVINVRQDVDSVKSNLDGVAWIIESVFKRFRTLFHMCALLPLYLVASFCLGTALTPGILLTRWIYSSTQDLPSLLHWWLVSCSVAAAYFSYGLCMVLVIPLANFVLRTNLKEWRGTYYSLPIIRWYIHNGLTCFLRYTFLELMTPTPFNILYFV